MTDIAMAALNTELPIISIGQTEQTARQTLARIQSIQTRDSSASAGRKKSHQSSSSPRSPPPLPRPNILAAHAYYLDNADPIESSTEAMQRRISLVDGTLFPRRHSVLTPAGGLDMRLEGFKFPPMERSLPTLSEPALSDDNIKIKKPEDDAPNAAETNTTDCKPSEIIRVPPHQTLPPVVPFEYTHDHLREWGYAYLGNAATADVFVNAVSLRRPSLAVLNKDDLNVKNERTPSNMVTVRARVLPKVKSRKPFMIQRRMDIEDLRAGIPKVTNVDEESPMSPLTTNNPRRSTRLRPGSGDLLRSSKSPSLSGKSSIPIHIEYALHYLPVLAALMLSGHVRKGDTIDLPMPQPEDWRAVISYIYTGSGDVSAAMRENILFLAGRV